MKRQGHHVFTQLAFILLSEKVDCFPLRGSKKVVADQSRDTDCERDLEFVDVDAGRDNPHKDEGFWVDDDQPHYVEERLKKFGLGQYFLTAFNHFIDIRKGSGEFDDFDGYSYYRGSASKGEYERFKIGPVSYAIDYLISWWFSDEYVHVPGRKWYRDCSPSVVRYSFPRDKGVYSSRTTEAKARFPLALYMGKKNKGIPYSVFMPVDNMARYWYRRYKTFRDPKVLGYVMHGIQDASVPHHAAGCCGNWHRAYEAELNSKIEGWVIDNGFRNDVKALFDQWNQLDSSPPTGLNAGDFNRVPRRNWRIEWLVTWMALNAYHAYKTVYHNFGGGWSFNEASAKHLTKKATALCMLALYKAGIPERCMSSVV